MNLSNKTILVGVSGGIAAYKTAGLVSKLKKEGADVHVLMTRNAENFVGPITFETLSGNKCCIDTFDRDHSFDVEHVSLAKKADLFIVAPATANVIAKFANGIADDMLTTTFLACKCPKLVVPAMNTQMYENPATQANLKKLNEFGIGIIEPAVGHLACGDEGKGKMPEPEFLYAHIERQIAREKVLLGRRVLISSGATCEPIDPVRYITNHSSGKMGSALAKECMMRGADVVYVKAHTEVPDPDFCRVIEAKSAQEMFKEITARSGAADIVIMAAAIADYTPATTATEKIKKSDGELSIELARTLDILKTLGERRREGQVLVGFSMETENLIENSRAKLIKKNVDMIVANNLKDPGSGFKTDTNMVTIIGRNGAKQLELMSKAEVAKALMDKIVSEGLLK